jgi:REP element-mobilizing transposase RayT
VRGYKSAVTKQIHGLGFADNIWQRNYYEHIIRNEQSYQTIYDYIIHNPSKWEDDKFYVE